VAGRIRTTEKSNDIGNRNRDLLACSTVSQPTMLLCAPGLVQIILETVANSDPKLINAKKINSRNVKRTIKKV
jgi:hypothetical protein